MTNTQARTPLSVAQEELTKVGYGGKNYELRFDFTRIMDAVSEELAYNKKVPYVIFGKVSETVSYFEKNKAKGCFNRVYTSDGQRRVTYSNSKLSGVASGKKKAKFTVDASWLVDKATQLVNWLQEDA